ncbi:histamine H2 receptor-like [Gigantopelta aegis]|uniref:histamine H2 receptor-like n=1 Tax=Gigantopelta aegis TaxID=1735272 RepID=UPI001B88B207|nr:histamine H2 receptor-like [Gigantopelta aegis]
MMMDNDTILDTAITHFETIFIVISVVMLLVICFGNALTLVAVWRTKQLRTVASIYIVSLAVIDTMIGIGQSIRNFVFLWSQNVLDDHLVFCAFILIFLPILVSISGFCMVLIAIDRYIFILHPLRYEYLLTPKRAGIAIGTIWVVVPTICCSSVHLDFRNGCTNDMLTRNTLYVVLGIIFFAVISISIIFLYTRILIVARRHIRNIHSSSSIERNAILGPQKTWKLIKHFLVVFGIFFVCWLPTIINSVISYFGEMEPWFLIASYVLILLNSSTNFLVYAWMNRLYREAFKNLLCCNQSSVSFDTTTGTIQRTAW